MCKHNRKAIIKESVPGGYESKKAFRKIRNRFFIVCILLSLVLLSGIMAYNFRRVYKTAHSDVIELSKNSSSRNAEKIELFLLRHEDVLLTTAEALEYSLAHNRGIKEAEDLLRNISIAYNDKIYSKYADKEFTGIYAAIDGTLIHGLKTPDDLPEGYNPLERQWYKEGVAGGGNIVFGEPYRDIYTPRMVMTATKLLGDGETVIAMDITLDDLQFAGGNMDVSITLNGNERIYGYGFVLTENGVVMAHRDKSRQGQNYGDPENPMNDVFRKISECVENGTGYFETDVGGVNCGVFPKKISNGWYVVTVTDLEDIRTSVSDLSGIVFYGTLVVTLLAVLYCILITRAHINSEKLTENLTNAFELAKKDGLTGCGNRTAYDMRVRELRAKMSAENDVSFACVMMDLNDLKYINDNLGHAAGDEYIRNSCQLIASVIEGDIYRIGGDEFAMFLTGELFDRHEELCARLKQSVMEANLELVPSVDKPGLAIGISTHIAGEKGDMDDVLRRADKDMYINKVQIKGTRFKK